MRKYRYGLVIALTAMASFLGCSSDETPTGPGQGSPTVATTSVAINEHNNLSLVVSFTVANADSARVLYGPPGGTQLVTPRYAVTGSPMRIVTLGLLPETNYELRVEVATASEVVTTDPVEYASGPLPDYLANEVAFQITGTPSPGYISTPVRSDPANRYFVFFDETGRIAWYRKFDVIGSFGQQLANGNYGVYVGFSQGWQPDYGYYEELTPAGDIIRRHEAPAPLYTDGHELLLTPRADGFAAHLFSYSHRTIDMTPLGGLPDALIAGHQIQRFSPAGVVEFSWDAWDHFSVMDWIELPESRRQQANADFDHPNSLTLDLDGHYVASFRDLAEITKINSQTGDIIWRLGGVNNQFTILNDPLDGFNGQHSVHMLENGNVLLFDNGLRHDPPESRAVEYELDLNQMTATVVWQYRHTPAVYTMFTGAAARRTNGNTVVQFAATGLVVEADPAGQIVWTGQVLVSGGPAILYRLTPAASLYEYVRP